MRVCTRTFAVAYGGDHIQISEGERVTDDHELVQKYPDAFVSERDHGRLVALRDAGRDPRRHEAGDDSSRTVRARTSNDPAQALRSEALRAIEAVGGDLGARAADRLDSVVRGDRLGHDTRYLAAVAGEHYSSAFGKVLQHGGMAAVRFTPEETQAVQAVTRAQEMRALAEGVGSTGGFAVPFALDPTIMLSSAGAIDPIREISRVVALAGTNEWRGVSSAGVTSNYGAEASEVNDDAPTLAQPTIRAERWTSFVPFSIEVGDDWASLQTELAALMADAKLTLDAQKLLTGTGVAEPGGILNIGGTGGLTVTQRVQTTTIATFAVSDVYALKQSLPPRFQANGTYVLSPAILDSVYRFVPAGSTTEPALLDSSRTALIGRPVREQSAMTATTTTGSRIAVYADWAAAFAVVDRLGVSVEIVGHLFGVNRRPTGQRGLFAYGRTGSGVINANAARYLEIK